MQKHWIPLLESLQQYSRQSFRADFLAGITVVVMLVPQGMAYAMLAGMPPIYGLYGGLIPLLIYPIFGTSRQLSIGPVAISALLVLAGVSQLAEVGSAEYVSLVVLTGLMVGIFQLLMSALRLGFLVQFLSHPIIMGFTSAAAIIIAFSQLKDILGFSIPRFDGVIEPIIYAAQHIQSTNPITILMCVGSMLVMYLVKRIKKSLPSALIVVVLGMLLTWGFQLQEYGLAIVGSVPEGLPAFQILAIDRAVVEALIPTILTVALIGIVESISIAKVLESKHQNYTVRPNQELLALGLSKIGGAFFQALPTSASFSRSAVNNEAGAKTGLASIIAALFVGVTLLFLTPLFFYLPRAILAAMILMAIKSLIDIPEIIHLWKVHRSDFVLMLITFLSTLLLGIELGVLAGVILSVLAVFYRSATPHIAVLGRLSNTTIYRNISRFDDVEQSEHILIIRFDNQLYFANTSHFKETIKEFVESKGEELTVLILDASSMHDIDSSGLHSLEEIFDYLKRKDIQLYLSGAIGPVRDLLYKSGLMEKIGLQNQFIKVHDAVLKAQPFGTSVNFKKRSQQATQTDVPKE